MASSPYQDTSDPAYAGFGLGVTLVIHGVFLFFVLSSLEFCEAGTAKDRKLGGEEILIEAAIAYKKPDAPKQPQKKKNPKREKKKVAVSRDEKKVPEKKEEPEKKKDEVPSWEDFKRETEEEAPENPDLEDGEADPKTGGAFDGKKYGWADENKGHPYMQEIARWVRFEIPTLEKGKGEAYACIRLSDDGKITDTKVRKSGNTNIDRAAEEALRRLVEQRNNDKDLKPVPSELRSLTTHWICFKPTG